MAKNRDFWSQAGLSSTTFQPCFSAHMAAEGGKEATKWPKGLNDTAGYSLPPLGSSWWDLEGGKLQKTGNLGGREGERASKHQLPDLVLHQGRIGER